MTSRTIVSLVHVEKNTMILFLLKVFSIQYWKFHPYDSSMTVLIWIIMI